MWYLKAAAGTAQTIAEAETPQAQIQSNNLPISERATTALSFLPCQCNAKLKDGKNIPFHIYYFGGKASKEQQAKKLRAFIVGPHETPAKRIKATAQIEQAASSELPPLEETGADPNSSASGS